MVNGSAPAPPSCDTGASHTAGPATAVRTEHTVSGPTPTTPTAAAAPAGVRIVREVHWPRSPGQVPPPLTGFTVSSFNPLVAVAAEWCLRDRPRPPSAHRTALLLASHSGDQGTIRAISAAVAAGRQVPPLLFFQSNPNAVLGHVAARWGLTGPVVAVSRPDRTIGLTREVLAEAALLLRDGDADEVLVIVAEQGRTAEEPDQAVAALVVLHS